MKEGKPKKQQTEGKFPKERVKKSGNQVRKKGSSSEKEETKTFSKKRVFKSDKPKEQVFKNKFSKPFSKTKEKALDVEKEIIQEQQIEGKFPKERVKKSGNQVRKKGSSSEKEETKTFSNKRVFKSDKPKEQVPKNKFSKPFSKTKEKALDVEKEIIEDWRLNKYIANAGICSRREADGLIAKGLIKVNGKVVVEMGYKVKPQDKVMYQNKLLSLEKSVYILLNKPKNFITTTEDPEERKTVMELIKNACEERVYPVGRLDRHTTGLLLFTNDGDLAKKLSHPSSNIKKVYQVMIDKPITEADFIKIQEGLTLEDGFIKVDALAVLDRNVLGVELHSGRNRIVRRIFEHLGYQVEKLDRTMYAGLSKKDLPRGKWRFLTEKEVILLKHFTKKK